MLYLVFIIFNIYFFKLIEFIPSIQIHIGFNFKIDY